MARRRDEDEAAEVADGVDTTVLDALDRLLTKGAMLDGDVTLGLAGIDLIYLRLSTVLGAADRLFPPARRIRNAQSRMPSARGRARSRR